MNGWDYLKELFSDDKQRYEHIIGVARTAEIVARNTHPGLRQKCVQAALLHDIGYAGGYDKTGFHPYDGYKYCMEQVQDRVDVSVIKIVLLHSGAVTEMLFRRLDLHKLYFRALKSLSQNEKIILEIITFSDMRTNSTGEKVSLDDRLEDIFSRYTPDTVVAQSALSNMAYFKLIEEKYRSYIT